MKLFKQVAFQSPIIIFKNNFSNKAALIDNSNGIKSKKNIINLLLSFALLLLFFTQAQAQSALNTGSTLNITTNTTYTTGSLNGSAIVTVKSGATVTFTGALRLSNNAQFIIEAGAKVIVLSGGLGLSNNSTFTANGAIAIRGGGLSVSNNTVMSFGGVNKDTIIGNVNFSNDIATQIDSGVDLFIQGDVKASNNADLGVDGNLSIDGDYQSSNNVVLDGNGTITTTGSIKTSNSSTVFGNSADCNTGPCNGNSLCGRTATASSSVSSICSGASVKLTGAVSSGTGTYQWQSSTTSNGTYSNVATGATITISPTATKYYRVLFTSSGCITTSNVILVTLNTSSTSPTSITGTSAICNGTSTTLTPSGGSLGTEAAAVWYEGASCGGGFTQDWLTEPYTTNMTTINSVNGILNVTTTGNDPMINMFSLGNYNPNTYKYINIRYKINSGAPNVAEIFFINSTYTVATAGISRTGTLITDGAWHVLTIDMSANPSWTTGGNITGWRFDYTTPTSTVNMDIDYISLTSSVPITSNTFSPTANTNYLVRYEGICNTTACASNTVTVTAAPTSVAGTAITTCANSGAINITSGAGATNQSGVVWTSSGTGTFTNATSLTLASYTPSTADKSAGSVTLTLTATGSGSCSSTTAVSTKTLTITPAPTAVAGTAITTCSNLGAVNITVGSSATNASVLWTSSGTGTFTSSGSLLNATYNPSTADKNAGSVILTLTATGSGGCSSVTAVSTKTFTISAVPTATAGGSQTICANGTATISGAASSNGTILWTHHGAGSITSGASTLTPVYTPAAGDAGNAVTLTMTVSNSPCSNATATYTVNVKGVPTATAGGSQTICVNGTATVSGAASGNGTILWTHNGAGSITSGASTLTPVYTPAAGDAGNAVTLTMTVSNSPCSNATATYTVNVKGVPTATAGGSQTICANGTATVSGAASGNGTILWTHHGAGSITSGASTLTPVYTPAAGDAGNAVTLTMTVSNSPCSNATATYTVNVKGIPTATAGGSQTICASGTATVSGAASSNGTILWTHNGAGSITSGASTLTPVYTPAVGDAGNAVTLTMTVSNSPCSNATATYTVNVKGVPTATAGGSQTICVNGTATISGAASSNGTILWTHNGAGSITSGASTLTPVYTPAVGDAGNAVTLTMTVSNSPCANATATYTVNVKGIPTAVAGTAIASCAGSGAKNITAGSSATNYLTIAWTSNGSGIFTSSSSLTNATYNPSAADITAGSVTLTLTATGSGACSITTATSTKTFTINSTPTIISTTPGTRCGAGSVALSATASAGTLNWYTTSTNGTIVATGLSYTPSISTTTIYYVDATNAGCSTSSRTAVTATVDNTCGYTWTGTASTVWNLASN